MIDGLLQDLRYGIRMLFKHRGFTIIALVTLALGIGATTAIFSVVDAVVLRPLPFRDPERVVRMWGTFSQGNQASTSPPDFLDYRAQNSTFEEFAARTSRSYNLTGDSEPERVSASLVTTNFFKAIGITPVHGRDFTAEEEAPGQRVAIISEGLWRRRLGGELPVIGKTLTLDGATYTVVGVAPNATRLLDDSDIWTPLSFDGDEMKVRRFHFLRAFGRLKPGISLQQARTDLDAVAIGLERQYPDSNTTWRLRLVPLRDEMLGDVRTPLYVLLGAVAFVLLIACANVANLLLARAAGRQKEIAIRSAMGARPIRLIRQLLVESLVLAAAGGGLGLLLAVWGTELLVKLAPDTISRAGAIGVDTRVLGFTLVVSLLCGVIFGLAPALQTSRPDLNESLKEGGKGAPSMSHNRTHRFLVVTEVALAMVLLVGAGLLVQSFRNLRNVDPGFVPSNVLTMLLFLPESKYGESGKAGAFVDQVLARVAALPGVKAVGTTLHLPFRGGGDTYFKIEGRPFADPNQQVTALNPAISHDFFNAMGISLLQGRGFTEQETKGEEKKTVIINESFARTYFPGEEPLGNRLIIDMGRPATCEIIGVTQDIKQFSLLGEPIPTMYLPNINVGRSNLVVRASGDPLALTSAIRGAVQSIDKDQPIANVATMEEILSRSVGEPRFRTLLLGVFAALALVLAAIGIYGVMSYTVARRTHEIGIRMALGARPKDTLMLIVGQGLGLALIGVGVGFAGAFGLTQLLSSLLFGVSPTDLSTFVVIALLLTGVAAVACYIPARRATRVDPMLALRCE
ncbi:MAG TPA: ABC transporter permease [Blastocatellia bacterium]|nr:ABC transporter permease [Blastocatellia bacterium]